MCAAPLGGGQFIIFAPPLFLEFVLGVPTPCSQIVDKIFWAVCWCQPLRGLALLIMQGFYICWGTRPVLRPCCRVPYISICSLSLLRLLGFSRVVLALHQSVRLHISIWYGPLMAIHDAPSSVSPSSSYAFLFLFVSAPVYLQKSGRDFRFVV